MKMFQLNWLAIGLRIILGGVFVYAGVAKALDGQAFADSIYTFQLLPDGLINLLAIGLPPFELFVGASLLVNYRTRICSVLVILMCISFIFALGQAWIRGLNVNCGCFGSGMPSFDKILWSLVLDVTLVCASVVVFRHKNKRQWTLPDDQQKCIFRIQ